MDSFAVGPIDQKRRPWTVALRRAMVLGLTLLVLTTAGCSGCNSKTTQQTGQEGVEEGKDKPVADNQKEDPLEVQPLMPLLGQEVSLESEVKLPTGKTSGQLLVKPGHWTTTVQEMKANYNDFVGHRSTALMDAKQRPVTLEHTHYSFRSTRPVALAKGRMKQVQGELFIPEQSQGHHLRSILQSRDSGGQKLLGQPLLQRMPSYQYFLVVVSKEISKYGFLKVTDAVRMPWEEETDAVSQPHYRVVLADATKELPLPSNPLTWSSVAYLVWDEVDPTKLSPHQQTALIDWIHWGGRLIINGPDSLDTLRGSFLADYLPVDSSETRAIAAVDIDEWSAYWSRRDQGKRISPLKPVKPWSGITLKPRSNAIELAGGAQLFYERNVGRGTVVVSGIQLAERNLINWPGYDGFLNGALLRRPRRIFEEGPFGGSKVNWADYPGLRLDAHFATGLRMFARDAHVQANQRQVEETNQDQFGQLNVVTTTSVDRPGGLGAWGDFNPVSEVARGVLADAAAVRVPGANFVLGCLGLYLIALVPLNWMVFRALQRVEWAWIAAPAIALLGTLVIVRQAQLDIGFVRSQTEVALLELQGKHQRGLLSRFTALYSSLSTTYDIAYENPSTVALPFPSNQTTRASRSDKIWEVVCEKQKAVLLSGLAISSASTKMVHSEEMFSLPGPLRLGKSSRDHDQIENRLGYHLRNVVVVRRFFDENGSARYESCWVGELRDGEASVLGFQPLMLGDRKAPHAEERRQASDAKQATKVDVEGLVDIALQFPAQEDPHQNRRDECRVVGLIDQVLPGTVVSPVASQIVGATVVLAHLEYGDMQQPAPDVNSPNDVLKEANAISANN